MDPTDLKRHKKYKKYLPNNNEQLIFIYTDLNPESFRVISSRVFSVSAKTDTTKKYCIKIIENDEEQILRLLERFPHKDGYDCITKAYGFYEAENRRLMIMSYHPLDLYQLILNKEVLSERQNLEIIFDISNGLAYIHACEIIHGDIWPANILLSSTQIDGRPTYRAIICDYDRSHKPRQPSKGGCPGWSNPERLSGRAGYGSDIYSFGLTIWSMLSKQRPFGNDAMVDFWTSQGEQEDIREEWPEELKEIMKACWVLDILGRPSAEELRLRFGKMLWIVRSQEPDASMLFYE